MNEKELQAAVDGAVETFVLTASNLWLIHAAKSGPEAADQFLAALLVRAKQDALAFIAKRAEPPPGPS